ncbi:hypothetical protein GSY47_04725 [Flavobacterium quisquiliarum]|nr:hypothetical protein [Flavobacterium quisquiliarum]NWL01633.1 hypothetical protein [Flavobacterium collinsii]
MDQEINQLLKQLYETHQFQQCIDLKSHEWHRKPLQRFFLNFRQLVSYL